jgi:hypothetical protein
MNDYTIIQNLVSNLTYPDFILNSIFQINKTKKMTNLEIMENKNKKNELF